MEEWKAHFLNFMFTNLIQVMGIIILLPLLLLNGNPTVNRKMSSDTRDAIKSHTFGTILE